MSFVFVEHEDVYVSTQREIRNTNIGMTVIIGGEEDLSEENNLMKKENNNNK